MNNPRPAGKLIACVLVCMATASAQNPPLGAGLDGIADYSHSRWFVDVMKFSRVFGQPTAPWNTYAGTYDATSHYPTQSFGLVILSGLDSLHEPFMYGTYKLSFDGQATLSTVASSGVTIANTVYNSSTNSTTADVTITRQNGTQIMLAFTNPVNVNNLKMISPGYSTTSPPLIRNEWVNVLQQLTMFRFMDWLSTNGNPVVSWADRHLNSLPGEINMNNQGVGCSWEDVCAFANQIGKDVWVNIPCNANDDYVTQCATLLKNNLNSNIHVYVEFSNEVWNFSFQQATDNLNAAKSEVAAGGSTLNNDGTTDQYQLASRRVVRRIYEISTLFKAVWGASAINTRVRCVVAGQLTYSHGGDLDWFNKTYGPPKNFFWGIANAPYWNVSPADTDTTATVAQLLDQLDTNMKNLFDNRVMDYAAAYAAYYGLEFMGYEGGPDTFGPHNQQAKADLNFDPRMKTISADFLTRWYQNGGRQFNWFVIGSGGNYISQYGTWPLLGWMGDSTINMKYQGYKQILTGTTPAITCGLPVPGSYKATQTIGYPAAFAANKMVCANPTDTITDNMYLLRSPSAGTCSLSITTSGGTAAIKTFVYVDNVLEGTLTVAVGGAYASSSILPVSLPQGLSTLRLVFTGVNRNVGCLYLQDLVIAAGSSTIGAAVKGGGMYKGVTLMFTNTSIGIANAAGIRSICLMDISGRIVLTEKGSGKQRMSVPLKGLAQGAYCIQIVQAGGNAMQRRVIVQ